MSIRVVRLGTARRRGEGLRLGTVRHVPRGVKKEDYARRDFFDVWMPELAPSAELVAFAKAEPFTPTRWASFERRYRAELREPASRHLLDLLAALSENTALSVGCYCEDASECHRSILARALADHGAEIAK